jgi:hypothetical protein
MKFSGHVKSLAVRKSRALAGALHALPPALAGGFLRLNSPAGFSRAFLGKRRSPAEAGWGIEDQPTTG